MLVAIILVNYNNNQDTIDCVKSIKKSKGVDLPFIVIVDNDSKLKNIHLQLSFYSNLKIIYNNRNVGFGKANNFGVKWVLNNLESDYIFLLNNDTEIQSDSISHLIKYFPNEENTVMTAPKILTFEDIPKIWYGGGFFNLKRMTVSICDYLLKNKLLKSRNVDFASGCAMFFKTDFLKSNICFDDNFFMYDEDIELCLRIKKLNKKIFFVNDAIVYHKCQGSQKSDTEKIMNQLHPNYPNLNFYLSLTIPNRFYILHTHFNGYRYLLLKLSLLSYWMKKALQYMIFGKISASYLTFKLTIKNL